MNIPGPPPPPPPPPNHSQQQQQNVGQTRQGQPGQQNFQNGGQQKANQGAQNFQNQYAPYDPELSHWVWKRRNEKSWEFVKPHQAPGLLKDIREEQSRMLRENPSVQKTLKAIPSQKAYENVVRLVQDETLRLQRENPNLEWKIAGAELGWKPTGFFERTLSRIEIIIQTQQRPGARIGPSKMNVNAGDLPKGAGPQGHNANHGSGQNQKGNQNQQFASPQGGNQHQQFTQSQGRNQGQGLGLVPGPPPPPPVQHMGPNQNMLGPQGGPGQPPPPLPPNGPPKQQQQQQQQQQFHQPQYPQYPPGPQISHQNSIPNIPGAFPMASSQPSMRHEPPKHIIENITAQLLKKKQSKSNIVDAKYEEDSGSGETDTDEDLETGSYTEESVEEGYGYVTPSRSASRSTSKARARSKSRPRSRSRDPNRGRVTKSYKDKDSHHRGSSMAPYPVDLHHGRSVEKPSILRSSSIGHHNSKPIKNSSPRSSKGALPQQPPVNVIINNPPPVERNRARNRDRFSHSDSDRERSRSRTRHGHSESDDDRFHVHHRSRDSESDREHRRSRRRSHDSDSDHPVRERRGRGRDEGRGRAKHEARRYSRQTSRSPPFLASPKREYSEPMRPVPSNVSSNETVITGQYDSEFSSDGQTGGRPRGRKHVETPLRTRRGSLYRSNTDLPHRSGPILREGHKDDYPGYIHPQLSHRNHRASQSRGDPMFVEEIHDPFITGQFNQRPQFQNRRLSMPVQTHQEPMQHPHAISYEPDTQPLYVEIPQYNNYVSAPKAIMAEQSPRYLPGGTPELTDAVQAGMQAGIQAAVKHMQAKQRQPLRRTTTLSGRRDSAVDHQWADDGIQYARRSSVYR